MVSVSRIRVYPVKSLDPVEKSRVRITEIGGLTDDRTFALFDANDEVVNGKRTDEIHGIRAELDLETDSIQLAAKPGKNQQEFHLYDDRASLEAWFSDYFDMDIHLDETSGGGFTDSSAGAGPTIISEATLTELASWFPDISSDEILRRLRPNIVLADVPAFWEDSLVDTTFTIGTTTLHGVKPVPRCVVPTRDTETGEITPDFTKEFSNQREQSLPDWSPPDQFDHYYKVMIVTTVEEDSYGSEITVGDAVTTPRQEQPNL